MQNDVLFYPNISFNNPKVIKSLSLLYDNVYRICPNNVIPEDSEELQPLLEEGSIGKIIDPSFYSEQASAEFLDSLDNWNAAALCADDTDITQLSRLHIGKTDQIIRGLFKEVGFEERGDWMIVPSELSENFMLFMAKNIAQKNNLALSTGSMAAWTATNYFNVDGRIHDSPMHLNTANECTDDPYGLFNLLVSELTPINIGEIPAEKIIQFKNKRKDEILNFRNCIYELKSEIEGTIDQDISIDRIEKKAKQLAIAQADYKKSADLINVKKWFGSTMMGIPAPIGLCNLLSIPSATTLGLAATGIALGGLYGLESSKEQIKTLNKDNPASFLIELTKDFKGHFRGTGTRGPGDINETAWNYMEEYIAD